MMTAISGNLIGLGFAQQRTSAGGLLSLGMAQSAAASPLLLSLGMAQSNRAARHLLGLGMAQNLPQRRFNRADGLGLGIGAFDLAVLIGGEEVDMCAFAENLTIRHGENEAYTCRFVLQQPLNRPAAPLDLYQWYAKEIIIEARHDGGSIRLYRGIIDSVQLDVVSGKTQVDCSDRRQRMIDRMTPQQLAAIGHYSEAVQGKFDNPRDELAGRLTTVPASYEFDAYGNGYLNPWRAGEPVRTIGDCDVFYRQPQVRLASVGQVVNSVSIELGYSYDRLRQRSLMYHYSLGLSICSLGYAQHPTLDAFEAAVAQTGWVLGGGSFEGDPRSQWVNCPGGRKMAWLRQPDSRAVWSGRFEAVKRWRQNVRETVVFTLTNAASIARYEALTDRVSASVSVPNEADWDAPEAAKYTLQPNLYFTAPFFRQPENIGQAVFSRAPNGDWYADLADAGQAREQAFNVLYRQAYVKMLASHRQNTLEWPIKFLPELSLRHTHRIEHSRVSGSLKVARFSHHFDLLNGLAESEVGYRFFQAPQAAAELTPAVTPPRPPASFAAYAANFTVQRVDLPQKTGGSDTLYYMGTAPQTEAPEPHGVIYRAIGSNRMGARSTTVYRLEKLRLATPQIEADATDAAEAQSSLNFEVGLFSDDIHIRI